MISGDSWKYDLSAEETPPDVKNSAPFLVNAHVLGSDEIVRALALYDSLRSAEEKEISVHNDDPSSLINTGIR